MLFYYGVLAFVGTLIIILCESLIKASDLTILSYTGEQWGYALLTSAVNFIAMCSITIAFQNERSGFITILGYIGLVYAALVDIFIFHEKLVWFELVGIVIVLCLNVAIICAKENKPAEPVVDKESETPSKDCNDLST